MRIPYIIWELGNPFFVRVTKTMGDLSQQTDGAENGAPISIIEENIRICKESHDWLLIPEVNLVNAITPRSILLNRTFKTSLTFF